VIVDQAWQDHRRWSKVADDKTKSIDRWRSCNLLLIVIGAACGALAAQRSWYPASVTASIGAVGAATLALAAIVQNQELGARQIQERVTARACSEGLKAAVYQYLAAVRPFDGPDRDDRLSEIMDEIRRKGGDLVKLMVIADADRRTLPTISNVGDYLHQRAENQLRFHTNGVTRHERLEKHWRAGEIAATAAAAVLSAVGGALHGLDFSIWVAVATTLGAALAVHLASTQHARIAASYGFTAYELMRVVENFDPVTATEEQASAFVTKVEGILASQNQSWILTLSPQA
jgi:hypothetical protein